MDEDPFEKQIYLVNEVCETQVRSSPSKRYFKPQVHQLEEWSGSKKNQFVTALPGLMTTSVRMTSFTIGMDIFQDTLM